MTSTLTNELIQRFKDTLNGTPPEWAWPFKPSIPLVGENYKPGKGLLIYASAENLSWHNNKKDNPLHQFFTGDNVWNRYRVQYEMSGRHSKDFFPYVGIQPANDGGLLAAGLFTAIKYGLQQETEPRPFLEMIAVTNWCKFSIKSAGNKDYLRDTKKLTESLSYVVGELALLHPAVVLIPKAVWINPILKAAMIGASPRSLFLPVPQFNARVLNCHLNEYENSVTGLKKQLREPPFAIWMENLCRPIKKHAWRYIAMLDGITTRK